MKKYEVSIEVAAPMACFRDPMYGAVMRSYPVPTFSACRGIFNCYALWPNAYVVPTRVEICRPLVFQGFKTNAWTLARKTVSIREGNALQLQQVVLRNVIYKIYGDIHSSERAFGFNERHALQEVLMRRILEGQSKMPVHLGKEEFLATYAGPLRNSTSPDKSVTLVIDRLFHHLFDPSEPGTNGEPVFQGPIVVRNGVLTYAA